MGSKLWQVPLEGENGARSGKDWVSFESVLMEHVRRMEQRGMKGNGELVEGHFREQGNRRSAQLSSRWRR